MRWKAGPPTTIAGLSGGQGSGSFHPHRHNPNPRNTGLSLHGPTRFAEWEVGRALLSRFPVSPAFPSKCHAPTPPFQPAPNFHARCVFQLHPYFLPNSQSPANATPPRQAPKNNDRSNPIEAPPFAFELLCVVSVAPGGFLRLQRGDAHSPRSRIRLTGQGWAPEVFRRRALRPDGVRGSSGGGRWEVSGERGNQPQCSPKRTAELSSTGVFEMAMWRG